MARGIVVCAVIVCPADCTGGTRISVFAGSALIIDITCSTMDAKVVAGAAGGPAVSCVISSGAVGAGRGSKVAAAGSAGICVAGSTFGISVVRGALVAGG